MSSNFLLRKYAFDSVHILKLKLLLNRIGIHLQKFNPELLGFKLL